MFKEYRKKLNLTQEALADKADLNTRTIQRIENEEEIPSLETLSKLVNALEIRDKDLIEYIKRFSKQKQSVILALYFCLYVLFCRTIFLAIFINQL